MTITVENAEEWADLVEKVLPTFKAKTAEQLVENMQDVVHVDTGFLKSSINFQDDVVYSTAEYAGVEVQRGGDHDFVGIAIEMTDTDKIMEEVLSDAVRQKINKTTFSLTSNCQW